MTYHHIERDGRLILSAMRDVDGAWLEWTGAAEIGDLRRRADNMGRQTRALLLRAERVRRGETAHRAG